MKKYVILAGELGNIGGAQFHYKYKCIEAEKRNYKVYIISQCNNVNVKVTYLKPYANNVVSELYNSPVLYTKKQQKKVIDRILHMIEYNEGDEITIESSVLYESIWGELVAKECNGKNTIYFLGEKFSKKHVKNCLEFLKFKYDRGELACISKPVMHEMFLPYIDLPLDECVELTALAYNYPENVPMNDKIKKENNELCIGIFGRIEKDFVKYVIDEIIHYCSAHCDYKFRVLLMGAECKESFQYESQLNALPNVSAITTGVLYPIPTKIFNIIDVCISSSGAAAVMALNISTISIDTFTGKAIGILGYDTYSTLTNNDNENPKTLSQYLNMVLFENVSGVNKFQQYRQEFFCSEKRAEKHFLFIENSEQSNRYYEGKIKVFFSQVLKHVLPESIVKSISCFKGLIRKLSLWRR